MNRIELTRALPLMRSSRITRTGEGTSKKVPLRQSDIVCSPRTSVAYSFLVSWQWLKTKLRGLF
jgi:hypothetical protein